MTQTIADLIERRFGLPTTMHEVSASRPAGLARQPASRSRAMNGPERHGTLPGRLGDGRLILVRD